MCPGLFSFSWQEPQVFKKVKRGLHWILGPAVAEITAGKDLRLSLFTRFHSPGSLLCQETAPRFSFPPAHPLLSCASLDHLPDASAELCLQRDSQHPRPQVWVPERRGQRGWVGLGFELGAGINHSEAPRPEWL